MNVEMCTLRSTKNCAENKIFSGHYAAGTGNVLRWQHSTDSCDVLTTPHRQEIYCVGRMVLKLANTYGNVLSTLHRKEMYRGGSPVVQIADKSGIVLTT